MDVQSRPESHVKSHDSFELRTINFQDQLVVQLLAQGIGRFGLEHRVVQYGANGVMTDQSHVFKHFHEFLIAVIHGRIPSSNPKPFANRDPKAVPQRVPHTHESGATQRKRHIQHDER
eukprot:TRINITY_DN12193_c0_g1_i9.p4 TRINITY_DN12193_c0_g1~~TRINITY_DN12193_c0_g1_i9.p4  ORF type:complete len:118 (-),score=7.90 TRINITY_DN12193_c0_g1_i9:1214-1567(-)